MNIYAESGSKQTTVAYLVSVRFSPSILFEALEFTQYPGGLHRPVGCTCTLCGLCLTHDQPARGFSELFAIQPTVQYRAVPCRASPDRAWPHLYVLFIYYLQELQE